MLLRSEKISRYEKIQSRLGELTYATRAQLQHIMNLGGDRNARRILLDMERMGFIKSTQKGMKIYYTDTRLRKKEINHILMRNDLYIKLGMPQDWRKEVPIKKNGEIFIISDASFKRGGEHYFVEIDYFQKMSDNYDKIKRYREVSDLMFRESGKRPTIIWKTLSESKRNKIEKSCRQFGIKYDIF